MSPIAIYCSRYDVSPLTGALWSWELFHLMINALDDQQLVRLDATYVGKCSFVRVWTLPFAMMMLPHFDHQILLIFHFCIGFWSWRPVYFLFNFDGLYCLQCSRFRDVWCHLLEWGVGFGGHWLSKWSSLSAISLLVSRRFYPRWILVLCTDDASLVLEIDVWLEFVFAFALYDVVLLH